MDPVRFIEQSHFPPGGDFCFPSRTRFVNFQLQQRLKLASQVDPIECAERVEAMISTALLHQEDIWDMLLHLFPDCDATASDDGSSADMSTESASSSSPNVAVIKRKLENAMNWCRLAQCRLQGVITEHSSPPRRTPGCLHF